MNIRKFKFLTKCINTSKALDETYKGKGESCAKCKCVVDKRYSIPSDNGKFIMVCHKCYLNYKAELNKKEADKPKYKLYIKNAISSVDHSKILYCESPALGIGAPKCSEECCNYGACHKKAYFEYIANKYNTTPDKIAIGTNFQFEKFVIEDREYSNEEVLEILKKYKAEEDKKYHTCERCGEKYIDNLSINMAKEGLDRERDGHYSAWGNFCGAWGYAVTPYLTGLKVTSKCGEGRKIKLCDHCVEELLKFLKGEKYDNNN